MAVDPSDDCTFWYSNQYLESSGGNAHSVIGAFKFPSCVSAPMGTLKGTVTDAASGQPVADAAIILTGDIVIKTDDSGQYQINLSPGDYTVTTKIFGYAPDSASVTIVDGGTTTQNFALEPSPTAMLSGHVTDGSGHGWGLYAEIKVSTPDFGQVADIWTDPKTGAYSVSLPVGFDYTLDVVSYADGYNPASATLTLNADATQDFALTITASCAAPGYAFSAGFGEDFNGATFPPTGWGVVQGSSSHPTVTWKLNTDWSDDNYTGGTGTAADADYIAATSTASQVPDFPGPPGRNPLYDTQLVTPVIQVSSLPPSPRLKFKANFQPGVGSLDVGINVDGTGWTNVLHWNTSEGAMYALPGADADVALGSYIPSGATSIQLRWHYYTPIEIFPPPYPGYYAQVDDVVIGGCVPASGGLVVGQVRDANTGDGVASATITDDQGANTQSFTNPADPNLAGGNYILFSQSGSRILTASADNYQNATASLTVSDNSVNQQDFALKTGQLAFDPGRFDVTMMVNSQTTKTFTLSNTGGADAVWVLQERNMTPPVAPEITGPFAQVSSGGLLNPADCGVGDSSGAAKPCLRGGSAPDSLLQLAPASGTGAGTIVGTFDPGIPAYGVGVDRTASDLWLGSPIAAGGDDKDYRFLFDGTNTGDTIDTSVFLNPPVPANFTADMAYDDNTNMLWQLNTNSGGTTSSCIFELDPRSRQWTGRSICPPFPQTPDEPVTLEYGLAYNPLTNAWYSASPIDGIIYHFDDQGRILDSGATGLPIIGLTYNPATGHLFGLLTYTGTGYDDVAIFDANNDYAQIGAFPIPLVEGNGGAGFGYDCNNNLWLTNTFGDGKAYEVASGETGWCNFRDIPWLSEAPTSGTTAAGAQSQVTLSFDGTGEQENTTSQGYLRLLGLNTPYPSQAIPVTVHWQAQPVDLVVSASASPSPVANNGNLVYTVQISNKAQANHGNAQNVVLSYTLPAGVSFIPDTGGACTQANGTVTCALGEMDTGASKTVTIAVQVTQAGDLASTFTATADEPQDPAGDNQATVETTVIGTADLALSGQGAVTINTGSTGTLDFTLTNAGPDAATAVTLSAPAVGVLSYQSATATQGSCAINGGKLACDIGEVAKGESVTVTLSAFGSYAGQGTVTAQATTTSTDPDTGNNSAQSAVTVQTASNGGGGGGSGSSGGGSLGWLALAALLGLVLAGAILRGRGRGQETLRNEFEKLQHKETRMHRSWREAISAVVVALAFVGFMTPVLAHAQAPTTSNVKITKASKFMRTRPLRDLRWNLPPIMQRMLEHQTKPLSQAQLKDLREKLIKSGYLKPEDEIREVPNHSKPPALSQLLRVHDRALQSTLPLHANVTDSFTQPSASFDGVGESIGYNVVADPPDPNAAVGEKYVVEMVNLAFGIFDAYDKNTGRLVLGPVATNSLWTGFGGPCESDNDGDVVVLYDQLAHRWILSQFAIEQVPSYECVAISQTDDPTGAYYLYAFKISDTDINDYPKIGVWPDAYYSTYNLFDSSSGSFTGVAFTAFDRAAMLAGDPNAQMVEIDTANGAYSDLPATLDGQNLPPAGAPGLFANYISPNLYGSGAPYALALWQMQVDWTNPANSELIGPALLNVDPFTDILCAGNRYCLPQPNTTNKLDAITDRLMYRLAYRNFGDHQALVVNQTVGADASGNPPSGVRWYELRAPAASTSATAYALYQQSTYAPADGNSRWMGSIAMDNAGDIALGYSLVGSNTAPSIAYTGRLAGDPTGEMTEPETILQPGVGEQTGNPRWGDYTSMAAAPNGCDFWYTDEYYAQTSGGAWSTHIGSFQFPNCTPAPQGILTGTVTDATSGQPIADVSILLGDGIVTKTDDQGQYQIELTAGDYTATTKVFGYVSQTATVTISDGTTTTQDFQLQASPTATVSGHVTDGSGHGWGLYAEIKVTTPDFGQVADVWSDPKTGAYSLSLPEGNEYTLAVNAYFDGYEPGSATLTLGGDTTQDFALTINTASCSAPGYAFVQGFGEDFNEDTFPPVGWTVTNGVNGSPVLWNTNSYWQDDNYTGGSGAAADVDESHAYYSLHWYGQYDTALITPPIAVTSLPPSPVLEYKANYQYYSGDALDLDISSDGGATWRNISHWTTSHGGRFELPGENERVNIAPYLPASGDIQLRWRYYKLVYNFGYYAQIDDVNIGQCLPIAEGLVEGQVTDANTGNGVDGASVTDDQGASTQTFTNAADSSLPVGYYFLFPQAGNRTLTADAFHYQRASADLNVSNSSVKTQNFALKAGQLKGMPADGFDISLMVNNQTTQMLAVGNVGTAAAHWSLAEINAPVTATQSGATGIPAVMPDFTADGNAGAIAVCAEKGSGGCHESTSATKQPRITLVPSSDTAGTTLNILYPGITVYGLGVDREAHDLWLGSPSDPNEGLDGDAKDHRYLFDGTDTGDTIDTAAFQDRFTADMAYDDRTGMLWQLNVSSDAGSSCIYELDPARKQWTGNKICPPFPISQRGLAYDPISNTWYAGDFRSEAIYHFDASGNILDAKNVGLYVQGLTYNPATGHLFVLLSNVPGNPQGGAHAVYVLDPSNGYSEVTHFDVTGFNQAYSGAGFGHDCDGHLWLTDFANNVVYEAASGETGWCNFKDIPWLSEAPTSGTLDAGAQSQVTLSFDGTGEQENTTSQAQIEVKGDTPYARQAIPVTVHWQAQPVDLVVSASASPSPVANNGNLVYTVQISNKAQANHGNAQNVVLSYTLPAGVSFIPDTGGACTQANGTVTCALGEMDTGASKTVTIAVQVTQAGDLASTFTATADEPQDPAGDNQATVETTVIGTADLALSGQGAVTINTGSTGTLDFTLTNAGPDAATAVTLSAPAVGVLSYQSATATQGSCAINGGKLACDIGEVAKGESVTVTLSAFGSYAGQGTVTAQATTTSTDPDTGNNSAQSAVTVQTASNGGGGGGSGSSGGGSLGWLALAALLGLVLAGRFARWGKRADSW